MEISDGTRNTRYTSFGKDAKDTRDPQDANRASKFAYRVSWRKFKVSGVAVKGAHECFRVWEVTLLWPSLNVQGTTRCSP